MMSKGISETNHCTEEDIWASPSEVAKPVQAVHCTDTMNKEKFRNLVKTKCNNNKHCEIPLAGLQSVDSQHECGDAAFVYAQLPCKLSDEQIKGR